jgi:hypothetical protein
LHKKLHPSNFIISSPEFKAQDGYLVGLAGDMGDLSQPNLNYRAYGLKINSCSLCLLAGES